MKNDLWAGLYEFYMFTHVQYWNFAFKNGSINNADNNNCTIVCTVIVGLF